MTWMRLLSFSSIKKEMILDKIVFRIRSDMDESLVFLINRKINYSTGCSTATAIFQKLLYQLQNVVQGFKIWQNDRNTRTF